MSNPGYVRSTDGSDSDNGSTWALANATLAGAMADQSAGDRVWVSDNHAESTGSAQTITMPGTLASPMQILCGDDAAEPPTALATTATVTATSGNINIAGSGYIYGIGFTAAAQIVFNSGSAASRQHYKNCKFATTNAGSGGGLAGSTNNQNQSLVLENCTLKWANANNSSPLTQNVRIVGGSVDASTTTPTNAFTTATDRTGCRILIEGFDFSNLGSSFNIFSGTNSLGPHLCVVRDCKLPASWSGSLVSGTLAGPGARYELYNCDSGDTNYRLWVEDYAGSVKHETTIVRTGGASDGATTLSWKMAAGANAEYPLLPLTSPEIVRWNDTTGSAITVTVETVTDGVTLTDAEAWLEVQYLGTSGFPLGTLISDSKADVLTAAANQASSSETWTTTGLGTPVKQQLSVTFTPQEKGFIRAAVKLAKASTTMYVDPELTVT